MTAPLESGSVINSPNLILNLAGIYETAGNNFSRENVFSWKAQISSITIDEKEARLDAFHFRGKYQKQISPEWRLCHASVIGYYDIINQQRKCYIGILTVTLRRHFQCQSSKRQRNRHIAASEASGQLPEVARRLSRNARTLRGPYKLKCSQIIIKKSQNR